MFDAQPAASNTFDLGRSKNSAAFLEIARGTNFEHEFSHPLGSCGWAPSHPASGLGRTLLPIMASEEFLVADKEAITDNTEPLVASEEPGVDNKEAGEDKDPPIVAAVREMLSSEPNLGVKPILKRIREKFPNDDGVDSSRIRAAMRIITPKRTCAQCNGIVGAGGCHEVEQIFF